MFQNIAESIIGDNFQEVETATHRDRGANVRQAKKPRGWHATTQRDSHRTALRSTTAAGGINPYEWLVAMACDPDVNSVVQLRLSILIALKYFNKERGVAWPSQTLLAKDLGFVDENGEVDSRECSVRRALKQLDEVRGYLARHMAPGRAYTVYSLMMPVRARVPGPSGRACTDSPGTDVCEVRAPEFVGPGVHAPLSSSISSIIESLSAPARLAAEEQRAGAPLSPDHWRSAAKEREYKRDLAAAVDRLRQGHRLGDGWSAAIIAEAHVLYAEETAGRRTA